MHKMHDHMDRTSIEKGGTSGKVVEDSGVWGRGINLLLQKNISSSVTPSKKKKKKVARTISSPRFVLQELKMEGKGAAKI